MTLGYWSMAVYVKYGCRLLLLIEKHYLDIGIANTECRMA